MCLCVQTQDHLGIGQPEPCVCNTQVYFLVFKAIVAPTTLKSHYSTYYSGGGAHPAGPRSAGQRTLPREPQLRHVRDEYELIIALHRLNLLLRCPPFHVKSVL